MSVSRFHVSCKELKELYVSSAQGIIFSNYIISCRLAFLQLSGKLAFRFSAELKVAVKAMTT